MGYSSDSAKIQCVEEVAHKNSLDDTTLAVFELANSISDPFTLNIIPIWERDSRNTYLVIDEIAYMGNCSETRRSGGGDDAKADEMTVGSPVTIHPDTIPLIFTTRPKKPRITTPPPSIEDRFPKSRPIPIIRPIDTKDRAPLVPTPPSAPAIKSKGTRYPFPAKTTTTDRPFMVTVSSHMKKEKEKITVDKLDKLFPGIVRAIYELIQPRAHCRSYPLPRKGVPSAYYQPRHQCESA